MPAYPSTPFLDTLAGGGAGASLGNIFEMFDYPRQSLYNLVAGPMRGDFEAAIPGAIGLGTALLSGGLGIPAAIGIGGIAGGAAQGIGKAIDPQTFDAPTPSEAFRPLLGDTGMLGDLILGAATDPMTYGGSTLGKFLAHPRITAQNTGAAFAREFSPNPISQALGIAPPPSDFGEIASRIGRGINEGMDTQMMNRYVEMAPFGPQRPGQVDEIARMFESSPETASHMMRQFNSNLGPAFEQGIDEVAGWQYNQSLGDWMTNPGGKPMMTGNVGVPDTALAGEVENAFTPLLFSNPQAPADSILARQAVMSVPNRTSAEARNQLADFMAEYLGRTPEQIQHFKRYGGLSPLERLYFDKARRQAKGKGLI